MTRPLSTMSLAVLDRLKLAGAHGLTLGEMSAALPGYAYDSLATQIWRLRLAGQVFTVREGVVVINYAPTVLLSDAKAQFALRMPTLRDEVMTARRLAKTIPALDGGPPLPVSKASPTDRRRRDHQLANRTARAIKGDGTHQPAKAPKPPATVEAVDPSKVQHCTGWKPRWAVTEPITSLPIGQYDTPPSPWATAATSARATT